jgi:hypothetical protein
MLSEPYYPVGIQDFSEIRRLNALYVDKTELIYRLTSRSKYVFLSRPRRFGKSLLSSTLQYYFEGRKELFTGLAMERLEKDWIKYPVFRFDLSVVKNEELSKIEEGISRQLRKYEAIYGKNEASTSLSSRMADLIERSSAQAGQKAVVLIDEYDAPILDVMHDDEMREKVRRLLREFYSPLKACDENLHFVFLTGISMFSQLSIFSELNNLEIISRSDEYASLCGITQQELLDNFKYGIEKMANKLSCSEEEVLVKLKDRYDGYHFSENSEGVFNPFSLLNAFKSNKLGSYWFASGTPRALVEMLKKYKHDGRFDVEMLDNLEPITASAFETPLEMQTGPIPLMYQAGYLTIKSYEDFDDLFTLAVPNSEVRVGLLRNLLPLYADIDNVDNVDSVVSRVSGSFRRGEIDKAMQLFQSMLASIPFMRGDKEILADAEKTEAFYHRIFFFFFHMLNNEVYAELRSSKGAADVVITTPKYIYIIEIKIDASADAALQQIEKKGYATPYLADGREIVKLGISFSTATRTIEEWKQA